MPYKREGRKILHKKHGKWSVKQTAKSIKNAKSTIRLLQGLEHGWKPTHHSAEDGSFLTTRHKKFKTVK